MRLIHRYLGYFLAGIMAVYAISGIVLVYRDTDFLKKEVIYNEKLSAGMSEKELDQTLRIKRFEIQKTESDVMYFKQGTYNIRTGEANYKLKEYPYMLDKMVSLHKAKSEDKQSALNVFFGVSLLVYVITSFWMYAPKTSVFRKGMVYVLLGLVLGMILLFVEF